ncbi:MAG: hypothetical protein EOP87_03780 [Verrucomicrobiaceae bacterium]|nr:MAG: hypothetical protein EOP87_03780 [Verrucomicrobiaceae bacterium]
MNFLQRHPFAVRARFERVVALSFAFPAAILRPMVPEGLELDEYDGWGFLTVALVWTKRMRPAFLPESLGQDFFLAGYRIFTRFRDETDRKLRGLQILRSETDNARMVLAGNIFTKYGYRLVNLESHVADGATRVKTSLPTGEVTLDVTFDPAEGAGLPEGSPFPDWRTARRFAGPMPFTFSRNGDGSFVVVEGVRGGWTPRPVTVTDWQVGLLREGPLAEAEPVLANAFMVEDVDYRWRKGRVMNPGNHR